MKTILTIALALSMAPAFGQMGSGSTSTTAGSAMGSMSGMRNESPTGTVNNNTNLNQPTTGNIRGNTINNTNTTTDTIGTTQSTTTRRVIPITPGVITQPNTPTQGVNCVDRSGRSYAGGDSGYTACVNSMRMR